MKLSALEIRRIAKNITDIDELGLLLKFEDGELDGYEAENAKDLAKKKGTQAMLKKWYNKDGSTRAVLVKALKDCDQAILAEKVRKGEFHEEGPFTAAVPPPAPAVPPAAVPPAAVPPAPAPTPASPGNNPATAVAHGVSDGTLRNIGKEISTNLDELASALGFGYSDLQRYKNTNYQGAGITADGIVKMLFDWREEVGASEQRQKLQQALKEAKLIRIQEKYLP